MNRRHFFKVVAAAGATLALPVPIAKALEDLAAPLPPEVLFTYNAKEPGTYTLSAFVQTGTSSSAAAYGNWQRISQTVTIAEPGEVSLLWYPTDDDAYRPLHMQVEIGEAPSQPYRRVENKVLYSESQRTNPVKPSGFSRTGRRRPT